MAHLVFVLQAFTLILWTDRAESQDCSFPKYIKGDYFSIKNGVSVRTVIDDENWDDLECKKKFDHPKPVAGSEGANHTFLVQTINDDCLYCIDVLWRTPNVLQVRKGDCFKDKTGLLLTSVIELEFICPGVMNGLPVGDRMTTMFKRTDTININCISTFEGVFQFTYKVNLGGGGICDNPESQIQACQDPGSAYIDNQVFRMTYARCRNVSTSKNTSIRYQCFGTWFEIRRMLSNKIGYTYAVIADIDENDEREKFKCLRTNRNRKEAFNKERWVMSRFANCKSFYKGRVRLVLTRISPATTYQTPQCALPRNVTGSWRGVQYQSIIRVNDTHIHLFPQHNKTQYQEANYSCQQSQGIRYLMKEVAVGNKCDVVYFTCFEFVTLSDSSARIKVSEPYPYKQTSSRTNEKVIDPKKKLQEIFQIACGKKANWSFRDEYEQVK